MRYQHKDVDLTTGIANEGFGIRTTIFDAMTIRKLLADLDTCQIPRSRAGIRHVMSHPAVYEVANSETMVAIASSAWNHRALPFRATLFDKSPSSNWLVAWHQDTALPLKAKRETDGWGPWSIKEGVVYAHAPAGVLDKVIALRLHLDDSNADNGSLRVLAGTHSRGVMTDEEIHELSENLPPVDCYAPTGAVVLMKPLVVHGSSKSVSPMPRRVLHIEYAAAWLNLENGLELAIS